MIKLYYGSNIDAVKWKIYTDKITSVVYTFPEGTSSLEVANKLCQFSLFDLDDQPKINVVDISSWKLTDKDVKANITSLHEIESEVIFAYESATVKNKLFTDLKIETVKCTTVTKKSKQQLVKYLINKNKLLLKPEVEDLLVDLLPQKIDFIKNEIDKLALLNKSQITTDDIRALVFNAGEDDVFEVINCWLAGDLEKTIMKINDLLSANYKIPDIVPIFVYKLVQLKLFLQAKVVNWPSETIMAKQGIPFWQQTKYTSLKPYDKNLVKINNVLSKLYNFDIAIKTNKKIPYTEFIKILFE